MKQDATHPDRGRLTFADFWSQRYATPGQYLLTKYFSLRLGSVLAYSAYRIGLSANAVTIVGLAFMLSATACLGLSPQDPPLAWAALVLFQLGFGFDCADGQLARATRKAGEFGAWLDNACDHIRYVGIVLATGALLLPSDLPRALIVMTLFVLGSGLVVNLHTVSTLKGGSFRAHGLAGLKDRLKWLVRSLSDTPFFLLLLCLLAQSPWLLALYTLAIGLMAISQSFALALLRIK